MPFLSATKHSEFTLFLNPPENDHNDASLKEDLAAMMDVSRRYRLTKLHIVQTCKNTPARWQMIVKTIKKHKRIAQLDFVWNGLYGNGTDHDHDITIFVEFLLEYSVVIPTLNFKGRFIPTGGKDPRYITSVMRYCALNEVRDLNFNHCTFHFVEGTNDALALFLSILTNKRTFILIECSTLLQTHAVDVRPFLLNNVDTLTRVGFWNNKFLVNYNFKNILELTQIESYTDLSKDRNQGPLFQEPSVNLALMCTKLHTVALTTYRFQEDIIGIAEIINDPKLKALRSLRIESPGILEANTWNVIDPLISALITNQTLTDLCVHDAQITFKDARLIHHFFKENDSLTSLDLFKRPYHTGFRRQTLSSETASGLLQTLAANTALAECSLPFIFPTPVASDVERFAKNISLKRLEVLGPNLSCVIIPELHKILARNKIVAPSLYERLVHWSMKTDLGRNRPRTKRVRPYAPAGQLTLTRQRTG